MTRARIYVRRLLVPVVVVTSACISACGNGDPTAAAPAVALQILLAPEDIASFAMQIGAAAQLRAVRVTRDGRELAGTLAATWSSQDPSIMSVDANGLVRARCTGTTKIVAALVEGTRTLQGSREIAVATTGPRCAVE